MPDSVFPMLVAVELSVWLTIVICILQTQYRGTTFAGYLGLITGQKDGMFTVSMNQRSMLRLFPDSVQVIIPLDI